mgnify:CR=1 FL=1
MIADFNPFETVTHPVALLRENWSSFDVDFGRRCGTQVSLYLCCGHHEQFALRYLKHPDEGLAFTAEQDARHTLKRVADKWVAEHDCATYERRKTLGRIAARLKS